MNRPETVNSVSQDLHHGLTEARSLSTRLEVESGQVWRGRIWSSDRALHERPAEGGHLRISRSGSTGTTTYRNPPRADLGAALLDHASEHGLMTDPSSQPSGHRPSQCSRSFRDGLNHTTAKLITLRGRALGD